MRVGEDLDRSEFLACTAFPLPEEQVIHRTSSFEKHRGRGLAPCLGGRVLISSGVEGRKVRSLCGCEGRGDRIVQPDQ